MLAWQLRVVPGAKCVYLMLILLCFSLPSQRAVLLLYRS